MKDSDRKEVLHRKRGQKKYTEFKLKMLSIRIGYEILQFDPKRMTKFSAIFLNKSDNKKRTSRSFSILFPVV